jgi:branched-chain amino acid aminotransferase
MAVGAAFSWMDGRLVPSADAALPLESEAILRGASVFEGIRVYQRHDGELFLFRLGDHLERLFETSMRFMRMRLAYGRDDLIDAIFAMIEANAVASDAYLRIVVYLGEPRSYGDADTPTGAFILLDEGFKPAPSAMRVTLSPWRRLSDMTMPPRVKASANYLNSRIAMLDARRKGFDTAVLLNERGKVSEGPAMNVFLVRSGRLITPRATDGILEGITRATVIEIAARELGIAVEEREIDPTELYLANEMFLCGTAFEIAPVSEVDGYEIGNAQPGPITASLQACYSEYVRGNRAAPEGWVTPVDRPVSRRPAGSRTPRARCAQRASNTPAPTPQRGVA